MESPNLLDCRYFRINYSLDRFITNVFPSYLKKEVICEVKKETKTVINRLMDSYLPNQNG